MTATLATAVRGANGLHARPASLLVQTAGRFQSTVMIESGGKRANLKSLLGLLGLGLRHGTEVLLTATGPDAEQAVRAAADILEQEDL